MATETHKTEAEKRRLGGEPKGSLSSAIWVPTESMIATSDLPQAMSERRREMKRISLFRRGQAGGKGREGGVASVSRLPSGSRTCASVE